METHTRREPPTTDADMDAILTKDSFLSDASVMKKAMNAKNERKFRDLWNGDFPAIRVRAKLTLQSVSIPAFYCNGNTQPR